MEEWWEPGNTSRFWNESPVLEQTLATVTSGTKKSTKMKEHSAHSFKSCPTWSLISFWVLKEKLLLCLVFLTPKSCPGKKVSIRRGRRCLYQLYDCFARQRSSQCPRRISWRWLSSVDVTGRHFSRVKHMVPPGSGSWPQGDTESSQVCFAVSWAWPIPLKASGLGADVISIYGHASWAHLFMVYGISEAGKTQSRISPGRTFSLFQDQWEAISSLQPGNILWVNALSTLEKKEEISTCFLPKFHAGARMYKTPSLGSLREGGLVHLLTSGLQSKLKVVL